MQHETLQTNDKPAAFAGFVRRDTTRQPERPPARRQVAVLVMVVMRAPNARRFASATAQAMDMARADIAWDGRCMD